MEQSGIFEILLMKVNKTDTFAIQIQLNIQNLFIRISQFGMPW